jgi:hypothetical protein
MSPFALGKDQWPANMFKMFKIIDTQVGQRNRYFGPYTSVLSYCIGLSSSLCVAPQKPPPKRMNDKVDLVNLIVYDMYTGPVVFIDIKDKCQAEEAELCYLADAEMRHR